MRENIQHPKLPVRSDAARLATAAGLALLLIGWTDLVLLWLPFRPNSPEWEFGTTSSFFDALPLATVGLILLALTSMTESHRRPLRALAIFAGCITLLMIAVVIIFVSDLPLALKAVQLPMREVLVLSITKTSILATIYLVFYAWLTTACWRKSAALRKTG